MAGQSQSGLPAPSLAISKVSAVVIPVRPSMGPPPHLTKESERRRSSRTIVSSRRQKFDGPATSQPTSSQPISSSSLKRRYSQASASSTSRSHSSSNATGFSKATKLDIERLCCGGATERCWHCGSEDDIEHSHVLPARETRVCPLCRRPRKCEFYNTKY